jgi:proteic killer suppression protein
MIRSFRCRDTEALFNDRDVPRFRAFERIARRKLLYLHRARRLDDLRVPPGNRLEALKGNRKGQYSIRVNSTLSDYRSSYRIESDIILPSSQAHRRAFK